MSSGELSFSLKQFVSDFAREAMVLHMCCVGRDDGVEDRYSVLVEFEDQKSADGFYLDLNGWRFSSSEVTNIVDWMYV
jgi:hypothetical protein